MTIGLETSAQVGSAAVGCPACTVVVKDVEGVERETDSTGVITEEVGGDEIELVIVGYELTEEPVAEELREAEEAVVEFPNVGPELV